jgi:hypothetical protein
MYPKAELERLKRVFNYWDQNGDGYLELKVDSIIFVVIPSQGLRKAVTLGCVK